MAGLAAIGLGSGVYAWSLPWHTYIGEATGAIQVPPFPRVPLFVFVACSVVVMCLVFNFYQRFREMIGAAALISFLLASLNIGSILTSKWWFPGWGTNLLCIGAGVAAVAPLVALTTLIADTRRFRDHPRQGALLFIVPLIAAVGGPLIVRHYWHAPRPPAKATEMEALAKAVIDHYLREIGAQYTPIGSDDRPEIFLSVAREDPSTEFLAGFSWSSIKISPHSQAQIIPFESIRSRVTGNPGELVSIQLPSWNGPRIVSVVRCTTRGPLAGWCDLYTLTQKKKRWAVAEKRCVTLF